MNSFLNDSNYLDQHFLVDEQVINKFLKVCNLRSEDIVVEIGAGKGVLTSLIAPKVKFLTVIEKDERLKKYLDNIPNIKIIYANCLDIDLPECDKIITSLPYSIIEPFIHKLINTNFKELYMIMGSNYVNSVLNNDITNLSLLTNSFFDIEKYFDIEPNSFNPKPRVLSSAIKLSFKRDLSILDKIFQNLYLMKDKKVKNSLMESLIIIKGLTKRESKIFINKLNISDNLLDKKFESYSNKELEILYDKLKNIE